MASLFGGPGSLLGGPDTSQLTSATNADRARSDEFYRQLALLQQQYQQQLAQQGALGRSLDKTIAGTAPSVAGTQLQQGVGEIANATRATAAGASGENAALANYGSIQALAQAQAKANQDAANLRAREVAQAQQTKAGILNQQQQATGGMHGADVSGALGESGQATSGAGTLAGVNENEINSERALASNAVQGAGAALLKSDEDEKEDIKPVSGGDMDQFLKHIAGFTFNYKDGGGSAGEGPGSRISPMAQDVAKGGPIGKSMVVAGKPMQLDMRNAIGAALAAVAHLNRKIEARG